MKKFCCILSLKEARFTGSVNDCKSLKQTFVRWSEHKSGFLRLLFYY
jgi:hypothetical protein